MIAPSRRLLLRIYAVSIAQLLAIAGTIALVGWLSFNPEPHRGFVNDARYIVANLAERVNNPTALQSEVERVREVAGTKLTVYGPQQNLLATSITPALRRISDKDYATMIAKGHARMPGPPQLVVLPLESADPSRGYVVFRHARPPPPLSPAVWALGIALIGAALAAVVLARSFVTPLSLLANTARKLGAGDLTARVRSDRRDEFGQLAATFDDMADRLTLVLRSQQELLANVSHELRTPLARIRVALDLASEGDASTAQDSLREITEDLGELERLVADVLQTAKLDLATGRAGNTLPLGHQEPVDVSELIEHVAQRFHASHPTRQLQVHKPAEIAFVSGDGALLRRAIENLLDNARAYSDEGSALRLRVEQRPSHVCLSVIDRGIGIAASDLPNIGRPFFRTDPSRARRTGGLGLGLSLARRIVEAHSGTLEIESDLGRGTQVHVTLPNAAEAAG